MSKHYEFNPEMYKTVGKNIRKYRKDKGLGIDELSEYAQIKKDFLGKFELAEDDLTISIYDLYKISVILDTSIEKFFEWKKAC